MALPEALAWECRTDGDNLNGGAFARGATGVDYSQQAAPEAIYVDLVLDTTTTISSVIRPFTSDDIGNIISFTGGTGFTVGRYYISAVNAGIATLDRAAGTLSSTGGLARLGGAIAYPHVFDSASVNGNVLWIRGGTYTLSSATADVVNGRMNFAGLRSVIGYGTVRGDRQRPIFNVTTTGNTSQILLGVGTEVYIANLEFVGTATGFRVMALLGTQSTAENIYASGHGDGIITLNASNIVTNCYIANCSTNIAFGASGNHHGTFINCIAENNVIGFQGANMTCISCISLGNSNMGYQDVQGAYNCVAYNNTNEGFYSGQHSQWINCISSENGYGYRSVVSGTNDHYISLINCVSYDNATAEVSGPFLLLDNTELMETPFTDPTNGDFGLTLALIGYPTTWVGLGTDTNFVIGPISGGSGGGSSVGGGNFIPGMVLQ